MIKIDLSTYKEELDNYSQNREEIIKVARDLLATSKKIIFSTHRKNEEEIETLLVKQEKTKIELDTLVKKHSKFQYEGMVSEANQEYIEGIVFYNLIKHKKFIEKPKSVTTQDYLLGLCDLSGEINRFVIHLAIENKIEEINFYHDILDQMLTEFMEFNFKNSALRKKYDSIKYALKNIENVIYDLSIKKRNN